MSTMATFQAEMGVFDPQPPPEREICETLQNLHCGNDQMKILRTDSSKRTAKNRQNNEEQDKEANGKMENSTMLQAESLTAIKDDKTESNSAENTPSTIVTEEEEPVDDTLIGSVSDEQTSGSVSCEKERPPWCTMIIENLSFILDRINGVDTVALRLFKEDILPEINCNSIVQNLKRNGPSSAADELLEFLYRDPNMSHHTMFYGILEETGQQELAQTLRDGTTEIGCSKQDINSRNFATLANPENLIDSRIAEELKEGKDPVHIAVAFCAESITRVLLQSDLLYFLGKLQNRFILELQEELALRKVLQNTGKHDCIIKLNCYLQTKTKSKINELIHIMQEWQNMIDLATVIEKVLLKCENVAKQDTAIRTGHVYPQTAFVVPARVKIKSCGPGMHDEIMIHMKESPGELVEFFYVETDTSDIQKSCIEINFKVKSHWELENLRKSIACGLFTQRYRSWLRKKNCEIPATTKLEIRLIMMTNYGEPNQCCVEKPLALHTEADPDLIEGIVDTGKQGNEIADIKEDVVVAPPGELTEDTIMEEFNEGKTPVHITMAFMSQTIAKALKKTDMTFLLMKLNQNNILEQTELEQLKTGILSSDIDSTDCIMQLNCILQRKTEAHIMEFTQILEVDIHTGYLANWISMYLQRIQDAYTRYTKLNITHRGVVEAVSRKPGVARGSYKFDTSLKSVILPDVTNLKERRIRSKLSEGLPPVKIALEFASNTIATEMSKCSTGQLIDFVEEMQSNLILTPAQKKEVCLDMFNNDKLRGLDKVCLWLLNQPVEDVIQFLNILQETPSLAVLAQYLQALTDKCRAEQSRAVDAKSQSQKGENQYTLSTRLSVPESHEDYVVRKIDTQKLAFEDGILHLETKVVVVKKN